MLSLLGIRAHVTPSALARSRRHSYWQTIMKNNTVTSLPALTTLDAGGFISRTLRHEALRKGVAAAAAGVLFAIAAEALFPSNDP